jgi:hypothetical protein
LQTKNGENTAVSFHDQVAGAEAKVVTMNQPSINKARSSDHLHQEIPVYLHPEAVSLHKELPTETDIES